MLTLLKVVFSLAPVQCQGISKGAACLPVKVMIDNPNKPTICLIKQSTKSYDKSDLYIVFYRFILETCYTNAWF